MIFLFVLKIRKKIVKYADRLNYTLENVSFTIFGLFGCLKYVKNAPVGTQKLVWQITAANYIDLFAIFIGLGINS